MSDANEPKTFFPASDTRTSGGAGIASAPAELRRDAATPNGPEGAPGDHEDGPEALDDLKRREQFGLRGTLPVVWAPDDKHPDYAHLAAAEAAGVIAAETFKLTPQVLDLLIKANSFDPKGPDDTFVFALRGAELAKGSMAEQEGEVELTVVRPDHVNFRCTLGYYHRRLGKISAFRGSTVPNAFYVRNYYNKVNHI